MLLVPLKGAFGKSECGKWDIAAELMERPAPDGPLSSVSSFLALSFCLCFFIILSVLLFFSEFYMINHEARSANLGRALGFLLEHALEQPVSPARSTRLPSGSPVAPSVRLSFMSMALATSGFFVVVTQHTVIAYKLSVWQ